MVQKIRKKTNDSFLRKMPKLRTDKQVDIGDVIRPSIEQESKKKNSDDNVRWFHYGQTDRQTNRQTDRQTDRHR